MIRKNAISWFEIPTRDINRAQKFYESILDIKLTSVDLENFQMRIFPVEDKTCVGGSLCYSKDSHRPSETEGPLIYLNASPDVQNILDKVEKCGGKIIVPKTHISPEYGYMAMIIDTEGNRVAFMSTL
jgi:predicted enzyme related to lactoylglutathione lyase